MSPCLTCCQVGNPRHSLTFLYFRKKDLWLSEKIASRFRALFQLINRFLCPENSESMAFGERAAYWITYSIGIWSPVTSSCMGTLVHFIWKHILAIVCRYHVITKHKEVSSDISPNSVIYMLGPQTVNVLIPELFC